MADEVHPVVLLLAARKNTHPEEFAIVMKPGQTTPQYDKTCRWSRELDTLGWYMNETEKAILYADRRDLVFDIIQGNVLRKLLDGADNGG